MSKIIFILLEDINLFMGQLMLLFLPPANEVWGKVMFSYLSVILFTGGVCPTACWDTHPQRQAPPRQTPSLGRHPLGRHPLGRHPPSPYSDSHPGQTPLPRTLLEWHTCECWPSVLKPIEFLLVFFATCM